MADWIAKHRTRKVNPEFEVTDEQKKAIESNPELKEHYIFTKITGSKPLPALESTKEEPKQEKPKNPVKINKD